MTHKFSFIFITLLLFLSVHLAAQKVSTPVVFYLQNLPTERIGTDSDTRIIADLEADGFLVILVDCSSYPTTSPEFEEAMMQFHLSTPVMLLNYETASVSPDLDRIFYVPAGYRVARDIPVWNIKEHGAEGSVQHTMQVYNDVAVPRFGISPVTDPDDMVGPNGEPIDYNIYVDIVYPSGTPANEVPLILNFSSNSPRQKPLNPTGRLEAVYRNILRFGFLLDGYAVADYDHCYIPLARAEHYGYFEPYSLDSYNGLASATACVRYLNMHAGQFNLNGKIGAMGISKAAYGPVRLANKMNATQSEHREFTGYGPNTKPQPWQGYSSTIDVAYGAAGDGSIRIPTYVDENSVPLITSAGRDDSYNHWERYAPVVSHCTAIEHNFLAFWMEDLGHTYPVMGTDFATNENRYVLFKRYFDHYLKPQDTNPLKVFYAYPKEGAEEVDAFGLSRTLPADHLLPVNMTGVSPFAPVTIRFLTPVDAGNFNNHVKIVEKETGMEIAGTWSPKMQQMQFEFTPDVSFKRGKTYRVEVASTLSDANNNQMGQDFVREFMVNRRTFNSGDVFFDDFNRGTTTSYPGPGGTPIMNWQYFSTLDPPAKIITFAVSDGRVLQIFGNNSSSNTGEPGRTYMSGLLSGFNSLFKSTLNSNIAEITWSFNMRNNKSALRGFNLANANYGQAVVLVSTDEDFLTGSGYAVTLLRATSGNGIYRLVRFENGMGADSNLTTLIESNAGMVSSLNYASIKIVYNPDNDTWQMHIRDDGGTEPKDPVSDIGVPYVQVGNTITDNTFTAIQMRAFGFFYNHGIESSATSAKAMYDNFRVFISVPSSDASLSDISVSLDGNNFNSLMKFEPTNKTYQYYLTKGHPLPLVQAVKNHEKASDPVIQQPTNLQGSLSERTATITLIAEDNETEETYAVEFIETDYIYITGLGNNGGGGTSAHAPEGWTFSNVYFTNTLPNGNNKFEGTAAVRCGNSATSSWVRLPATRGVGTLSFYARKVDLRVEGELFIEIQKDGGNWMEIANLGDISNLEYQEFIVPINQQADQEMFIRLRVSKNGNVFSSPGYYFDDFSFTGYSEANSTEVNEFSEYKIRHVPGGFAVDVASAEVQVYNSLGMLQSHTHVKGTHIFSLNRHGVYIIRIENSNGDNVVVKYIHQ